MAIIMMTENLARKISINNLQIPLCSDYKLGKSLKKMGNVLAMLRFLVK